VYIQVVCRYGQQISEFARTPSGNSEEMVVVRGREGMRQTSLEHCLHQINGLFFLQNMCRDDANWVVSNILCTCNLCRHRVDFVTIILVLILVVT
jgi:hypothetical protein